MNTIMRSILVLLLLALSSASYAIEREWRIATNFDIPGKKIRWQCLYFANCLHANLRKEGFQTYIITYDWHSQSTHESGRHAYVVYKDRIGRYWGMDNLISQPKWLPGENPAMWTAYFDRKREIRVILVQSSIL